MTTQDLATREALDMETVPEPVRELARRLNLVATTDTASAQLDIMAKILSATSEEELFAAATAGTKSGTDEAGRPFLILDWEAKRTAAGYLAQGAFPFYVLIRAKFLDNGEEAVLTCGGFTFVSVIDTLDRLGLLSRDADAKYPDGYAMTIEAKRMASGFDVLIPHPYALPKPTK